MSLRSLSGGYLAFSFELKGTDESAPEEFGKVCSVKKQRRNRQKLIIIDLFLDFAKNTTLHGLRYIAEVGLTVIEKLFWAVTFLISVILCFILIERVWHKWWYSPVIVSFNERMIPVGEVPFPSITICPQWKCKRSAYNYTDQLIKFKDSLDPEIDDDDDTETYEKEMLEDAFLICSKSSKFLLKNRTTSNETIVKNIMKMAPDPADVIYDCLWRGRPCKQYFKEVLTSEGVCLNFNALSYKEIFRSNSIQTDYKYLYADTPKNKWNIFSGYTSFDAVKKEESSDETNEMKLESNPELEEYPRRGQENGAWPDLRIFLKEDSADADELCNSLANGWKIYLQHPADMPQASLYYYAAITNQVTSLALKFSVINTSENLLTYRSDQRQCYFPNDRLLKYFATYTPDNCRLECLSLYTYKKCKCVWYHMPHNNSSEICSVKKRKCVYNAQDELASDKNKLDSCNCLPSCETIHYDAEILKTMFDMDKHSAALNKIWGVNLSESFRFSKVEVYFKEPRYVSMRRSELFGLTDFLANCGGLLGLFLGFSFLSLVEMFYFLTLRLWCTLKRDIKIEKKQLKENIDKKA